MNPFKRILFPIEFSKGDDAVAPFVLSFAQRYQAELILLHVYLPPSQIYFGMEGNVPGSIRFQRSNGAATLKTLQLRRDPLSQVDDRMRSRDRRRSRYHHSVGKRTPCGFDCNADAWLWLVQKDVVGVSHGQSSS